MLRVMRAVRYHGRRDVRFEDLPRRDPLRDEVTLRVHAVGICGSDVHEYFSGPVATSVLPHPLTGVSLPVVLGHEFAGTVVDVGPGVDDVAIGTLVAVEPVQSCGTCARCRHGRRSLCRQVAFHGLHRDGGGLSEFTVVPRSMVHRVPAGVSADQAALTEPLAVALRAARRTRAVAGELVVVHGAGPIGIGALLSLRAAGVRVAVVDPSPVRRDCAARLGAELVLDPADDVRDAVHALTDGYGADGSIDAAGVPSALRSAVTTTRPDGTVVVVALHHERTLPLSAAHLVHGEVLLTGSLAYTDEFPAVLELLAAGAYPLDGWVRSIAFERLVPDGFEPLARQEAIKVLVRVSEP